MSQRPLSVYFLCLYSPPISLAIRWGTSNQNFGKHRRARHCAASKRRAKFLGYKCLFNPCQTKRIASYQEMSVIEEISGAEHKLKHRLSLGMFMSDKILIIHIKEDLALSDLFHIYATVWKL